MGYKVANNDPSYLCHYNDKHDPKTGRFAKKNKYEYVNGELTPEGKQRWARQYVADVKEAAKKGLNTSNIQTPIESEKWIKKDRAKNAASAAWLVGTLATGGYWRGQSKVTYNEADINRFLESHSGDSVYKTRKISHSYLCHFNPFHSKKNGQFTFKTDPYKTTAQRNVDAVLATRQDAVNKAISKGDKLVDTANALGEEYKKAFNNAKLDDNAKKQILDGLEEAFGKIEDNKKTRLQQIKANVDDEEYFGWILEEQIDKALFNSLKKNESLAKLSSEFEELKDSYWKDVHAVVDDLAKKYENTDWGFVNDYIYRNKMNTSVPSYITRHFDDYWVNDTDEHYAAIERWTKELESDSASHSLMHFNPYHDRLGRFDDAPKGDRSYMDSYAHFTEPNTPIRDFNISPEVQKDVEDLLRQIDGYTATEVVKMINPETGEEETYLHRIKE